MTLRVPILGQDDMIEPVNKAIDYGDDLVTRRNLQSAPWTKVVLDVDDQKQVALCHVGFFHSQRIPVRRENPARLMEPSCQSNRFDQDKRDRLLNGVGE